MRLYYVEYTLRGSSQSAMTTYQPSDTTELAQLVERRPFKPTVMGSIPIFSAFGLDSQWVTTVSEWCGWVVVVVRCGDGGDENQLKKVDDPFWPGLGLCR